MYQERMMDGLPISCLKPDMNNVTLVGVVVKSERPRVVPKKYAAINKRYVFNLTVKDEHNESINASCWGMVDYVVPISSLCYIGAFVQITNPRIRQISMIERSFSPEVSSSCRLDLAENVSTVVAYQCRNAMLLQALCTPLPSAYAYITIEDIFTSSFYSEGDIVNLVVLVAAVGPVLDITTKDGRPAHRLEVKLIDHTNRVINLILWDSMIQQFAQTWQPFSTVVHLTDIKILMDRYTNRKILTGAPRSVYTIDPQTDAGRKMTAFATHHISDPTILQDLVEQQSPNNFHRDEAKVATVAALHHSLSNMNVGCREQLLLRCFVTSFQLEEGLILYWKCGHCGRRISPYKKNSSSSLTCCFNANCSGKQTRAKLDFDMTISISDTTGTLTQCRLRGDAAEKAIAVKPGNFLTMSPGKKKDIESRFLLERCEVGVRVEQRALDKRSVVVLHLQSIAFPSAS